MVSSICADAITASTLPSIVSLSPSSGSGQYPFFAAVYSDPNGIADLRSVSLLLSSSNSTVHACYVTYYPAANLLYLADDAGNDSLPPLTPGSFSGATYAANSECVLGGQASAVRISGDTLTLLLEIDFQDDFSGSQNIYLQATTNSGLSTGPVLEGNWTETSVLDVSLSRSSLSFTTNPNLPQSGRVYVTNNSSGPLSFAPMINGSGAFTVTGACPTIEAGATCSVQITYNSTRVETDAATLSLNPSDGESYTVALTGNSVSPAVLVSRSSLSFATPVGDADYERVYITNDLPHTLNLLPTLPSAEFSFQNNCAAIAAFQTCAMNIAYTPMAGETISEPLDFNFQNSLAGTPSSIPLNATSQTPPPVVVSTTNLELTALQGTTAISTPVTIANNTPLTITLNPFITGSSAFTLNTGCATLASEQSCTIMVNYSPTTEQIDTAAIALDFGGTIARTPTTIQLQGFAPSPSTVSVNGQNTSTSVSLSTNVGTFQTSLVTVLNGTAHTLTLSPELQGSPAFQISQPCTSIAAKGMCQMTVLFKPTATGPASATLKVNPTNLQAGDNHSVPLLMLEGVGTQ